MADVRLERLEGRRIAGHLADLARLRIEVFRDYPYLYDGTQAYEERYLRAYAEAEGGVVVGAFDGDELVGASTALPLREEPEELTRPFADRGYDLGEVFYLGESVLLKRYRGTGLGLAFFREREAAALSHPRVRWAAFCAVVRPLSHPRRPADHEPLDRFWHRRGYDPAPGMVGTIAWRDLDEEHETPKDMQFWVKRLR